MSEASQKELDLRKPFLHPYRQGNDQRLDVSYDYVFKIIDFIYVQWLKQEFVLNWMHGRLV